MKRMLITGGTGLIGRYCAARLRESGYSVVILSRNPHGRASTRGAGIETVMWDGRTAQGWQEHAEGAHGIINLAGESIAAARWTNKKKNRILESRIRASRAVVEAVEKCTRRPQVVIQASAVGYYGDRGETLLNEESAPGEGFLAEVVRRWEQETESLSSLGVRRVLVRTGVVLARDGGMFPGVVLPFRFFIGGVPGEGNQWISWIHIKDWVDAVLSLLEDGHADGVYNLTAPHPLTAGDFYRLLGRKLGRPVWFPMPGPVLKLLLGEMAGQLLLAGQRVVPARLVQAGFRFSCPDLQSALNDLLK